MNIKPTILNVAGVVQIIYSVIAYFTNGQKGDTEGWGMLAMMVLIAFGLGAIILDIILQKTIKYRRVLFFIEAAVIIITWFYLYRYSPY